MGHLPVKKQPLNLKHQGLSQHLHNSAYKAFLLFCCLALCSYGKAQLNASFTADVLEGCAPLVVQFTDVSAGNPTSWVWDLGNGSTSTQQNPGTIYFTPGTYNVKLVVRNGAQADSVIKNAYIVVYGSPVVNFGAVPTTGCAPMNVQFTDSSLAGAGTKTAWDWDFGDGTTSTVQSPLHFYSIAGDYNITLRVTNSFGCRGVLTRSTYIHVKAKPVPTFTSATTTSCNPPTTVAFTNTSAGGPFPTIRWSFGDGGTSTAANPSHTYTTAGTYNVKLLIYNTDGCRDSIINPVVVGDVVADFTAPDTVCQGAPVRFTNTSSPATASSFWRFGDGTTSTQISPTKIYNATGRFIVKLVNDFGACKDSITKPIYVTPQPTASFNYSAPPTGCTLPVNVSFTSTSAGTVSYQWNFGDGSNSTAANPTHTYNAYGSYNVRLIIKNARGCTDTIIKDSIVAIVPVQINGLNDLPHHGCIPFTDTFSAPISSPEPVATYLWNFGDGNTSTQPSPVHTYSNEGSYTVTLSVTTVNGCKDTLSLADAVSVWAKPVANFSATPLVACAYQLVQFTDMSSSNVTNWSWQFGDHGTSHDSMPLYHYTDTGSMDVTLIVGNHFCYDTLIRYDYVYIRPPIAKFKILMSCDTPYVRTFVNQSVSAQTSSWNFGDGNTSTIASPVHTYAAPGVYLVKLRVTNGACYDDHTDTVRIIDEHPRFVLNSNVLCRNTIATFTATNIDTSNIQRYTWSFGDGPPTITTALPQVTHKYNNSGLFSPSLTITDILGCTRTVTDTLSVRVFGPKANFSGPAGACLNTPVTIADQSIADTSYPIVKWTIDFGDGTIDSTSTPPFVHTYTAVRSYSIKLIVRDSYGCTDTIVRSNIIDITSPHGNFKVVDSVKCTNTPVSFNNLSTGTNLTYAWYFGDGLRSASKNPSHAYAAVGLYDVKLVIKDKYGCLDSITKSPAVSIQNPRAIFTMSDSVITCPPGQIKFMSAPLSTTSVKWDFADGSFSNLDSPIHSFNAAGTYNVKLIAFGHGTCSDTMVKQVIVRGPGGTFNYLTAPACAPLIVSFSAHVINNNNQFTWDFGDGTTVITPDSNVVHTYQSPGQYVPKLLLRDTILGCNVSIFGNDTVVVTGAQALIKSVSQQYCDSAVVHFFDSTRTFFDSVSSYHWSFGDGGTSNVRNPIHTFTATGIYNIVLTVTTMSGCTDSSNATVIRVVRSPRIVVSGNDSVCVFAPASFSATLAQPDTSQLQWLWTFGNGDSAHVQNPPAQTYSTAGNFTISSIVSNSSGCRDTARKVLRVKPLPNVSAGTDTAICLGDTITLHPSGALTYVWQPSPTLSCISCPNPLAYPTDSLVYYGITGTSVSGCKSTDSVIISVVQPFSISVNTGDTLCRGESFQLLATGTHHYNWLPVDGLNNPNIANPVASPDTTTTYTAIGHDYKNCFTDSATVRVIVYPIPQFNIVPDVVQTLVGNSVTLTTTNSPDIISWTWTPATGLDCPTCAQPVATPNVTTTYTAVAANRGGCTAQDKVTIQLECTGGNVYVPNTFSPNGDGMNDLFYPRGKGVNGVKFFHVFNRWGALIFERTNFGINDPAYGWDGTYKGQPLSPDVFVYDLEVTCANGELFKLKGDVTLIR